MGKAGWHTNYELLSYHCTSSILKSKKYVPATLSDILHLAED